MSKLFSNTTLICTLRESKANKDLEQVKGKNLKVIALPEPLFRGHTTLVFTILGHKIFLDFSSQNKKAQILYML